MQIRFLDVALTVDPCPLRLPFQFGAVTLTEVALCTARVTIETEGGGQVCGFASDMLAPKWFEKDPKKSLRQDAENLFDSVQRAATSYLEQQPGTAFALWLRAYRERVDGLPARASDRLVHGFGVALLERAMLDATCRAADMSFFDALKGDLFGFRAGDAVPALSGWDLASSLAEAPLDSLLVRHTVGMADALTADEVVDDVADGFPVCLEDDIARYGLRAFKVKIGAGVDADVERLLRLADLFERRIGGLVPFTVDGNEQYHDLAELVQVFDRIAASPAGARLLEGCLYIEQPLHRSATYDPRCTSAMSALSAFAPVITDEADAGLGDFEQALALGYRGVSIKSCKGIFRGLLNRGLAELHGGFLSAEDLTTLPVLAVQQDLAVIAAHGITHAERNGHHYVAAMRHLPCAESEAALQSHPDLYQRCDEDVALKLEDGSLSISSLQCSGLGYDLPIAFGDRTPAHHWRRVSS